MDGDSSVLKQRLIESEEPNQTRRNRKWSQCYERRRSSTLRESAHIPVAPYLRSPLRVPTGTEEWCTGPSWQGHSLWADLGGWCDSPRGYHSRSPAGPAGVGGGAGKGDSSDCSLASL